MLVSSLTSLGASPVTAEGISAAPTFSDFIFMTSGGRGVGDVGGFKLGYLNDKIHTSDLGECKGLLA